MKSRKISIRLDEPTHEFLVRLADLDDCSVSSVVRMFLKSNIRAIVELKNSTSIEVAKWFLQQQAAQAVDA